MYTVHRILLYVKFPTVYTVSYCIYSILLYVQFPTVCSVSNCMYSILLYIQCPTLYTVSYCMHVIQMYIQYPTECTVSECMYIQHPTVRKVYYMYSILLYVQFPSYFELTPGKRCHVLPVYRDNYLNLVPQTLHSHQADLIRMTNLDPEQSSSFTSKVKRTKYKGIFISQVSKTITNDIFILVLSSSLKRYRAKRTMSEKEASLAILKSTFSLKTKLSLSYCKNWLYSVKCAWINRGNSYIYSCISAKNFAK